MAPAIVAPAAMPVATADGCPDIEVIFARGTNDDPGVGRIGNAFIGALRGKVGGRSVGEYAVNYPASYDFLAAANGANDASGHIQWMMDNCPGTRLVLGGYSQGAAVVDLATNEMPPSVADHVAAAALFGGPRTSYADSLSPGPLPVVGPLYAGKTVDMCVPNDPICFEGGRDWTAHGAYVPSGMVDQAASFAAGRL
jgi:cutinase-like protein